ncbi:hypoxanthine-guanine phosphoribosyltransferase [Mayamaea pseudoterrestris]|nr:hypoxanthine-guanine phosphoribosyltransferase [Mayamaea pseudoterrestris]
MIKYRTELAVGGSRRFEHLIVSGRIFKPFLYCEKESTDALPRVADDDGNRKGLRHKILGSSTALSYSLQKLQKGLKVAMATARCLLKAAVLLSICLEHGAAFSTRSLEFQMQQKQQHRHLTRQSVIFRSLPRSSLESQTELSVSIQQQEAATSAAEPIFLIEELDVAQPPKTEQITVGATDSKSIKKPPFPIVVWRFTRPHTLIGSALAIPALHLLAAPSLSVLAQSSFWSSTLFCVVPSLLMNLYITGLNQITDVEIDKINKPNLPIAAGILSKKDATIIVITSLIASLSMGMLPGSSQGLRVALWGSAILGTMYSLPPFRLKRFPLWAAFCIVAVRGTIINASFYAHAKQLGVMACLKQDPACLLSSLFYCVFGVVIALMKDVPDVAGDVRSNVRTFSVRLGQKRIFQVGKNILIGLFGAFAGGFVRGAVNAPTTALTVCRSIMGASCVAAMVSVQGAARNVDPMDSKQVYKYYMHLWKWFYLSYLSLPFAR